MTRQLHMWVRIFITAMWVTLAWAVVNSFERATNPMGWDLSFQQEIQELSK